MKLVVRIFIISIVFAVCGLADDAKHKGLTKDDVIAKAKRCLLTNHYASGVLDSNKGKDILNPENRIYSNSVTVSDDFREVQFIHDGKPYDSDTISFRVSFYADMSLSEIEIHITPGGFE